MRCFFCTDEVRPGEKVTDFEYMDAIVNVHVKCRDLHLAQKTMTVMTSATQIKENIMAENTTTTPDLDAAAEQLAEEETQNWLQRQVNNHPRASKAVAIIGTVGTAAGAVLFAKTLQSNKSHLDAASQHAQSAVTELSSAVVPQDQSA